MKQPALVSVTSQPRCDGGGWRSEDNLISRLTSYDPEKQGSWEASMANDPWEPLPVPKEFLDKAFEVKDGKYNLLSWEVVLNQPFGPDDTCRKDFYFLSR